MANTTILQQQSMHMPQQQQAPNQSQQPLQAQQQPPSHAQQASHTPQSQNQQYLSVHSQADQIQRNGMHKQQEQCLLNSYVYDFLKRSGATETARAYLREGRGDIKLKNDGTDSINGSSSSSSDNNMNALLLPDADVPVQAPEGFLYEWWNVFWDIYSAKTQRAGTSEAQQAQRFAEMRRGRFRMDNINQLPGLNYQQQVVAQAQANQQQVPHALLQPNQFNNRQQMGNGVIDSNNTNGDMSMSPQRLKMQAARRLPASGMTINQLPMSNRFLNLQQSQHQTSVNQNNVALVPQQGSQAIQNQGQQKQQSSEVNQGQVQQSIARDSQSNVSSSQAHMTPNQLPAQLNPATKRPVVDVQAMNQNIGQQSQSPNKRPRTVQEASSPYAAHAQMSAGQRQLINNNMNNMLITQQYSASPDKNCQTQQHINGKAKGNQPMQYRAQQMPNINKSISPHVNQMTTPMIQNAVTEMQESQLVNQIHHQINAANTGVQDVKNQLSVLNIPNISTMPILQHVMPHNNANMIPVLGYQQGIMQNQQRTQNKINNIALNEKNTMENFKVNINQAQLARGQNDNLKGAKTTPTQSQLQVPNGNATNAIAAQNGLQSQQSAQSMTTGLMNDISTGLDMKIEELSDFLSFESNDTNEITDVNGELNEFFNFDAVEFPTSNAGPSTSTTNDN
ncbi:14774_t:CDS:10 [Funneliformis caledonium]|uniref:14774_t:CDS:1 n=1 Tax=Funneliformis caledonium TaxID=1117310 RepID=A0A9N9A0S1_9GLOM|nr:14774_t:CDS:10 [Funneliformis caledonium]